MTNDFWCNVVAFLDHWQALVAGVLGFGAAVVAVLLALGSERRKAKNEFESIRRALGIEIRQYTANAYRAHLECLALLDRGPIGTPAIMVEDKVRLPMPYVYPNAVNKIGSFGACSANIVLFYNRIIVAREAGERILHHPEAANLPRNDIAQATNALINIAKTGVELLPFTKTGVSSHDDKDDAMTEMVEKQSQSWAAVRNAYGQFIA